MNKTGLKTFVWSFVFTLSVIVGSDRAFFYTPEKTEENLKIPRKNIALFFSQNHPQTFSSQVEPVYKDVLQTPEFEPEELKIAQNIPVLPSEFAVKDIPELSDVSEIPLVVEDHVATEEVLADSEIQKEESIPDLPLVYAGLESKKEALSGAQKEILPQERKKEEKIFAEAVPVEPEYPDLTGKSIVIKANKQIIKIDNSQKQQDQLQQEKKEEEIHLATKEDIIPLQNSKKTEEISQEKKDRPLDNQVASLSGDIPLAEVEDQVAENKETETERQWQTMAEKHHTDSPWVVASGSRYVKNKQLLKEKFASEAAKKSAEKLLPSKITDTAKSAKVAVQDNLLIPIPQDLLDEDDLIPDISNDEGKKGLPAKKEKVKKKEKTDSSFLDNLTSVFSKENRDKAIKNLKQKTNKLINKESEEKEDVRPQILPTEIRLSFQPNRAEISGQTLRWIQAFARKAVDDKNVGLEIRIDGSKAFELQQKRLTLLYNILTANDVPYQKINTVFVDREPNSFVVRTVKIVTEKDDKKKDDDWKRYYQKW